MQKLTKRNQGGFTLVELVIVIAIIAIIATIAVLRISLPTDKAKEAVLQQNCDYIKLTIYNYYQDYMSENLSGGPNYSDASLSGKLEKLIETGDTGNANEYNNKMEYVNPYSHKKTILNLASSGYGNRTLWNSYPQSAVVIANHSSVKYENFSGSTNLTGSIIVYMNNNEPIEIYYGDKDGNRSDYCVRIDF